MSIRIQKAGVLDTIQDRGRWGYSHWGINPGGVMDTFATSIANWLVGNEEKTPVLEMHFPAPSIQFREDALISICGADFFPCINNIPISTWQPFLIKKDTFLSFQKPLWGARCYLAVQGGFKLNPWLGSYSTHLLAHAGGLKGNKLMTGDSIPFAGTNIPKQPLYSSVHSHVRLPWKPRYEHIYKESEKIAFTSGPEWEQLEEDSRQLLSTASFEIGSSSDRMGYRLHGPALLRTEDVQLLSSGVHFGAIQLLPDGQLIILMADHQTTGGYPRVGFIVGSSLPKVAQSEIRKKLRFELIHLNEAIQMVVKHQSEKEQIKIKCVENLNSYYAMHGYKL